MKKTTMLIIAIAFIIIALLAGQFYFSQQDFGLSNPYWNGLLHIGGDARPLYGTSDLSDKGQGDVYLVMSPQFNFMASESSDVASFLERGGSVVVMDDYGNANSLLNGIGSPITLYQVPLCQDLDFYLYPAFPVINNVQPSDITKNVSSLVYDHPVSLNITEDASVIASTTRWGWLDLSDDGLIDVNEPTGSYPVIASAGIGNGTLMVIGDPDLFINSMMDMGDNRRLASNLLTAGSVYVDMSHGQTMPPLAQAYYLVKYDLAAQLFCVLAIFLLAYLYYRHDELLKIFKKPEEKTEKVQDVKEAIIERLEKTPLKKEEIREIKRKL